MKNANIVTLSLILSVLFVAGIKSVENNQKQAQNGCQAQLGRYQPWGPGWIRPTPVCHLNKKNLCLASRN